MKELAPLARRAGDAAALPAAAVALASRAARAVHDAADARGEKRRFHLREENDALRARVAHLEAGAAALRDATEDAMRQRATSTGEHALLTARLAVVEADARRARERNQALVRDAQLRACLLYTSPSPRD